MGSPVLWATLPAVCAAREHFNLRLSTRAAIPSWAAFALFLVALLVAVVPGFRGTDPLADRERAR
jgi:hypothetical protein